MEVRVYGLGYVGLVTALGLSKKGLKIKGIEVSEVKVKELLDSRLHLYEPGLDEWFQLALRNKNLTFAQSSDESESESLVSIVCVGTPMGARGTVDLTQLRTVLKNISSEIRNSITSKILIVIRSTIPPGTCLNEVKPIIDELKVTDENRTVDLIFYPEFLREGQAIHDYENPQVSILGTLGNSLELKENWREFLSYLPTGQNTHWVNVNTAEMMKYAQNSYNALRISFVNELATIASQYDVNTSELYELMQENQANESQGQYLRPGFSYGGPCLVKEVEALSWMGRKSGHDLPLISSISHSNLNHYERFLSVIEQVEAKSIIFLGAAFKPGTDDLRNSFIVKLVEDLLFGPTYKSQIQITVLEKNEAVTKAASYWSNNEFITVLREDELVQVSHDLVVFGSFRPDNKLIESLSEKCKKTINLGFFDDVADFNF